MILAIQVQNILLLV
ncbi:UNVERIFIED_CONTAM: hypothetical protein GTU68_057970 [Idotea baltica]|nr:hypothetical protein [Idotea baltica]